jgi:hypothetical protein
MPDFDVDPETIRVFPMDDEYWFSHYFDRQDLFERLREYYNEDAYRFEIPAEEFETVRETLAEEYVELDVVKDREAFCVVKDQYSEYGDVLRDSVAHWERQGQRFFLMKDELAVKEALERGAEQLTDTGYVLGV